MPLLSCISFLLHALSEKGRAALATSWAAGQAHGTRDRKGAQSMEIQDQSTCQQNPQDIYETSDIRVTEPNIHYNSLFENTLKHSEEEKEFGPFKN